MSRFAALLRRDVRGIYRDGFLLAMAGYSLVIAVACRIVVRVIPIDHIELYLAPFVLLTACSLVGLVFGFGLIEERETKTALLLRVVPVSPWMLTGYWVAAVGGFCLVIALACAALYGVPPARPAAFVTLTAVTCLTGPFVMLLLGVLASNKIEGLAVGKIISGSSLGLIVIFVLPSVWQVLLVWHPWYWVYMGLLRAYAGPDLAASLAVSWLPVPPWVYGVVPAGLTLAAIVVLSRRYRRGAE